MKAFVVHGPLRGSVEEVEPPVAAPGLVVVDVERVGVCGTDVEFYTGENGGARLSTRRPCGRLPLRARGAGTMQGAGGVAP